jgi:hypothetical protein
MRLAFEQHRGFATGLKGIQRSRTIGDAFRQGEDTASLADMLTLDLLIGSGGVLSNAPDRAEAALMLVDAFQPEGLTRLAVDSIFMLPQLGVLATVHPEAARQVLLKDCLIPLGVCLAPVGPALRDGTPVATVTLEAAGRPPVQVTLRAGELTRLPLAAGETARLRAQPVRGFNAGAGPGDALTADVEGGAVGVLLDGRGRPLALPENDDERIAALRRWQASLRAEPRRGS